MPETVEAKKATPKKGGPKKKTKQKFKGRFNHDKTLEQQILDPVSGPMGIYLALREAVNNAIDAGATQVIIYYGTHDGLPSITISDNGKGFNHKGVESVMSFAYSSRDRQDVKTIGANGTGTKCLLSLGNYRETTVIFETVSKELETPLRMENTYDYLLKLIKSKARADDHIQEISKPKGWTKYLPDRTTGTDVTIVNIDRRKIREKNLADNLAEVLTPRAAKYVSVQTAAGLVQVEPRVMEGKKYEFTFNQPSLGEVHLELYYGKRGDGPSICGPVNEIQHFSQIAQRLSGAQKAKIGHIWKTVSGYIYLERGNVYRVHNNTFGPTFFESEALQEFLALLEAVGPEIAELNQKERDQVTLSKREHMLDHIISANHLLCPAAMQAAPSGAGVPKKYSEEVDVPVKLVPERLMLRTKKQTVVRLYNQGTDVVDLVGIKWTVADGLVTIVRQEQGAATIATGTDVGTTTLTATGTFGSHEVIVVVHEGSTAPYIKGPPAIRPGGVELYHVYNYHEKVAWRLAQGPSAGIEVTIQDDNDTKEVSVSVEEQVAEQVIVLVAHKPHKPNEIVAQRKLVITKATGHKNTVIRINNVDYNLEKGFHYPNALAQIDYLWNGAETLPTIVFNPLHERVKRLGNIDALPHYLAAIAQAALVYQVENGTIKASEVVPIAEDFIATMGSEIEKALSEKKQ